MAYQIRERDPIFDEATQAMIERRGKELLGLALVAAALAVALILGSYSPDDPGWMSATEGPAQNMFGQTGATIASPLVIILGYGAWGFAIAFAAWGLRHMFHSGEERFMGRAIFAPIAIALGSVYASTLVPSAGWTHSFGLGGLFGDTVLGAILGVVPGSAAFGLKLLAVLASFAALVVGAFSLGFTRWELGRIARFMIVGVVMSYAGILKLARMGVRGAAVGARAGAGAAASAAGAAARGVQERQSQRRDAQTTWTPPQGDALVEDDRDFDAPPPMAAKRVIRAEPPMEPPVRQPAPAQAQPQMQHQPQVAPQPAPAPQPKGGLLSRMPGLMKRQPDPEPELVDNTFHGAVPETDDNPDRISAKIANALRNRTASASGHVAPAEEPPTTTEQMIARAAARARAQRPQTILRAEPVMRAEPPVTAGAAPVPQAPEMEGGNIFSDIDEAPMVEAPYDEAAMTQAEAEPLHLDSAMRAYDRPHEPGLVDGWTPGPEDDFAPDYEADLQPEPYAPAPDMSAPAQPQAYSAPPIPEPKKVVQHPPRKAHKPSSRAMAEAQPSLAFSDPEQTYELPPLSLLTNPVNIERHHLSDEALEENARMLEAVLDDYGVKGEIVSVRPGPVVTMYELEPAPGLKASRVIGLADDIARSMSALSARVSTVPGRSVIGIELPNANREKVVLREILSARDFGDTNQKLPLALGKDIGGDPIVANLAKMPHLLIAGTTGSGKSVAINTMILSLLYRLTPEECRLIMIDPKMLELSVYDGIPHLLSPVVTDPKKAVVALKWVVGEMEERYRKMSKMGVRNIDGYNSRVADALGKGEMFSRTVQTGFDEDTGEPIFETEEFAPEKMPFIVVVVDEMADLMMVAGKEIEACIQRLAQMARASGIHIIMATQRPSVDVITGTIKANFPTRISFQVTSKVDSRTILGEQGAEQLLGMGDMLYMAGGARITRVHGPFVSDEEVEEIVTYLKSYGPPEYIGGVVEGPDDEKADNIDAVLGLNTGGNTNGEDALYDQAVAIVIKDRKCSTSYIQRKLGIGYNKAARLVEQMEEESLVSPANHVGKREILVPEQ
ncbi:DNA translocase FtsK [Maritimibacter sp. UBA3975]|uniref:DNA translocase FtsK n=1 Tax=Maritimibacter sp. UBA3975 TaxID=1946833 RepID=UPI000C0B6DF2|nr:DNA translocase FtsK [Maritimibacter sp. UBA3975]MAM62491.1 cell division protein FtsK [Maritimibacter sp.]